MSTKTREELTEEHVMGPGILIGAEGPIIVELRDRLVGMTLARNYEKTAHARSTRSLRDHIARLEGRERQRGWEDDWLAKLGE